MGLRFENNIIEDFDVIGTFGKMNFLEVLEIRERDEENNVTEEVEQKNVIIYSEKLNDQVEISISPDFDTSQINYDDEVELTGHVTARGWLYTFKGYNDSVQTEQAFKVRAVGIKKVGAVKPTQAPQPKEKQENKQ
ncbi:TPA: DUF961 domain-containing protein [Enterococcus faecalis]|uniref:DUF961 domain-containing protein n=1 Tax=Enterococcus faecalis RP2S-4 TaxID=1244145 RepID=A0ABC9TLM9_ENTFL|nr:DUF961 family protein [Enterococcus faecalis]EPI10521.1 hypothetical protein D358_00619 [Enterococcus faecalis RP2S-4]HAP3051878.1 DUF961 domain-containing protein [Enterococcus faecalis]